MRPLPILLGPAGLLAATLAWSAPRVPAVEPPAAVRVGEACVTEVPPLPAGVEECELFLLPDDGSGRMIQLTPEREAADGPLRWRMPRVSAKRARLVLRAGGRFGETESAPSASFAIEQAAPRGLAELLRGGDELAWHFGAAEAAGSPSLLPPAEPALDATRALAPAAESPRGPVAEVPVRTPGRTGAFTPGARPDPASASFSRRPRFVPLRN